MLSFTYIVFTASHTTWLAQKILLLYKIWGVPISATHSDLSYDKHPLDDRAVINRIYVKGK